MKHSITPALAVLAVFATGCVSRLALDPQPADGPVRASEAIAFIGLSLKDRPEYDGPVVNRVLPGPLKGTAFRSPYVDRGDVLLAVNGRQLNTEQFSQLIEQSTPGDELTLRVRRTDPKVGTAMPTPGDGNREEEHRIVLAHRSDWTGPVDDLKPSLRDRSLPEPLRAGTTDDPLAHLLLSQAKAHGIEEPVDKLLTLLADTQDENNGANALTRVSSAFQEPLLLPRLHRAITDPMVEIRRDPATVLLHAADNLDLRRPQLADAVPFTAPPETLEVLAGAVAEAQVHVDAAFARLPVSVRTGIPVAIGRYMETLDPYDGDPQPFIHSLRASMDVDFIRLLDGAGSLAGVLGTAPKPPTDAPAAKLPRALRRAVTGSVLTTLKHEGRWYVYGGAGANTYDLSQVDVVVDAGGDDTYTYSSEDRPAVQVVIDLEGDDTYESDHAGPASACLGLSIFVDHKGDDTYRGTIRSCGSALYGVAILLDRNGADEYHGTKWSIGAGFYGVGAVLDLGGGNDIYWAHDSSEGIGGPRGLGLVYDQGGNELYRANGPTPSAYGMRGTFYGLSQGVGFGVRLYDTGGIGLLMDLNGNDRYDAGEFSQGGAYYWGLGILDDRNGHDLYSGDRYAQGFGCHQAVGVLVDHAGDDMYWAKTAAGQGAAWDIAMGLLLDCAGNDAYRADGLSQGSAAMQGIGWLVDLDGVDRYTAGRSGVQGESRGNAYHYHRTGCQSWSVLLDAGGDEDVYSAERPNNTILSTGKLNEKKPENSSLHGLFIDLATPLDLPK